MVSRCVDTGSISSSMDVLLLELKAVDRLTPVHRAQVHSYLRISQIPIGLLMNFNEVLLQDGIKRIIL